MQTSQADWEQNTEAGEQKLKKCEGRMKGFGTPIFKMEKLGSKLQNNWMWVNRSNLHVSTARLKMALSILVLLSFIHLIIVELINKNKKKSD